MLLADYYFDDPQPILISIEHLTPAGVSAAYRALVLDRSRWDSTWLDLFDQAFSLYWQRTTALARRTCDTRCGPRARPPEAHA